ncbi:MAG: hypothetical protein Q9216_001921 [Gyalolechia sp. 2 TL-2023]
MKIIVWAVLSMSSVFARASGDRNLSPEVPSSELQQVLQPNQIFDENAQGYETPPQGHQILVSVDNGLSLRPADADYAVHESLFGYMSLGTALGHAKTKARELNLAQVALDIESWVQHHPWKAAIYTVSALGLFAPEIISIPALEALGFGLVGVRAGKPGYSLFNDHAHQNTLCLGTIAAKIQSVIGPIAARSVFAIWQSARMGGYGVEYVNGGVRALIALTDAAVAACNPLKDCKGLISDDIEHDLNSVALGLPDDHRAGAKRYGAKRTT